MLYSMMVVFIILFAQVANGQVFNARFVARESSYKFSRPTSPRQRYIVEIEDEKSSTGFTLHKVVYFVPTNGLRSGVRNMSEGDTDYRNVWKMTLSAPQTEEEKELCTGIDNFSRDKQGKIYHDAANGNPVLMFISTRFNAEMTFDDLDEMPCKILTKFER